jgi:hypothetical protein
MTRKVQMTKDYRVFQADSGENRRRDLNKHKKLVESMKLYGFLQCYPIVVRDTGDKLIVKDGQHRLMIAELLGLPVYYVEETVDFDVALVNSTAKIWVLRDYAQKYAANGIKAYQDGLDFADRHNLPIGTAFALLAGTTGFTNCSEQFIEGAFKVKDQAWANAVAGIYGPLVQMAPTMKNARFIEACMAVCRVKEFDSKRLLACANRCRDKLVPYSTRDAYLDMLEQVYNFGRSQLFGLKTAALMALRERNPLNRAGTNGKPPGARKVRPEKGKQ